jgi:hypothetical protein
MLSVAANSSNKSEMQAVTQIATTGQRSADAEVMGQIALDSESGSRDAGAIDCEFPARSDFMRLRRDLLEACGEALRGLRVAAARGSACDMRLPFVAGCSVD